MTKTQSDESQNTEYKEAWRDEYLKWICGFANAQGGKVYIGVNDDHVVVGVADSKKLMEDIPNKIVSQLGIVCDVNLLTADGLDYIEIVVEPNSVPISYHGKYHYRSGSTKQEMNGVALQQFVLKKMGRSWDEYPREKTTLDAIDAHLPLPTVENDCGGTLVTIKRPTVNPYRVDDNIQDSANQLHSGTGTMIHTKI